MPGPSIGAHLQLFMPEKPRQMAIYIIYSGARLSPTSRQTRLESTGATIHPGGRGVARMNVAQQRT